MKKIMVGVCAAVALLVSAGARSEAVVIGYDILDTNTLQKTGFWSGFYTGTVTGNSQHRYYKGGGGSLNDGLVPLNEGNVTFSVQLNTTLTLHLSEVTAIDNINFFASMNESPNSGALTGATITIGGVSQALGSTGWGPACGVRSQGLCNDRFSFAGTALAGLPTDTIVFSNFTSSYWIGFAAAEITVEASIPITPSLPTIPAVPEPQTYAMLLAGLGLTGWAARRRNRA